MNAQLLPEEDALDDPDEDGDADSTLPGDLWFRRGISDTRRNFGGRSSRGRIVYSDAFAPLGPKKRATH